MKAAVIRRLPGPVRRWSRRPGVRRGLWFIGLWLAGLVVVGGGAYLLRGAIALVYRSAG